MFDDTVNRNNWMVNETDLPEAGANYIYKPKGQ